MNVRDFNVKTSSPDEDRLETVLHFVGETFPRVFVINRLDREVDYVTVDGVRFERVRECHDVSLDKSTQFYCSICECTVDVPLLWGSLKYCPHCGAKVVNA